MRIFLTLNKIVVYYLKWSLLYILTYASVIAIDFLSQHPSPNHGLWETKRLSPDGEDPPEKVGCRKRTYFLELMYVDVVRDFVSVVFNVLLYGAKGSHSHRDCCCFELPHSFNLDSQGFVFGKLFRSFDWGGGVEGYIVMPMGRQVLSFLLFSTMSGLLPAMVLSVWMGMSHRMVTLSCSYHRSFTSTPNSLQIIILLLLLLLSLLLKKLMTKKFIHNNANRLLNPIYNLFA